MKKWELQNNQKNIFFSKKNVFIFFLNFLFFDIFCIFQEVKKSENFCVFSYKWNLRDVFELKFWPEKLISFDENVFGDFYRLLLRLKILFIFWDSSPCSGLIWKKEYKNLIMFFQKCSTFEISFVALQPKFEPIGWKFHQKYSFAHNSYQTNFEKNSFITSS